MFSRLADVIEYRKTHPSARSYTTSLLTGGVPQIGRKIIEEAEEVVEAGLEPLETRQKHVVHEAADIVYHLFVLLSHCDISLSQLEAELERRFGVSGLEEKAARAGGGGSGE